MRGIDMKEGSALVPRRDEEGQVSSIPKAPLEDRWTPTPSAGMEMPVTTLLGVDLPSLPRPAREASLGHFPTLARSTVRALSYFPELRDPHRRSNGELHLGFQLLFGGVAFSAVLKHIDRRTPEDMTEGLLELYHRAGRGEILPKERNGATFWIIDSPFAQDPSSTALLDGPVLGLSRPIRRSRGGVSQGQIPSSSLSLTYESRWIRAGAATSFLLRVKKGLEVRERLAQTRSPMVAPATAD